MSEPLLLTSAEAAAWLKLGEKTLRKLRKAGLIRYVANGDRGIMYRPEDCAEYVASRVRRDEPCEAVKPPTPKGRGKPRHGANIIPFSERRRG
jgi:hypothetical protein